MPFDSFTFVLFFGFVLTGYVRLHSLGLRKMLLLVASLIFYAGWNPWFLPLLLLTSSFDFWVGQRLLAAPDRQRKSWLLLSLISNLGVLAYFKYRYFLADNFDQIFGTALHAQLLSDTRAWVLPVGISFYTFQSMSYCIDCYRKEIKPGTSWLDFTLYVAFFPQLVAGPIVRFTDFYPQLQGLRRPNAHDIGIGFCWIVLGLFLKVVLADSIFAPGSDALFSMAPGTALGWHDAATGAIAFTGQIFCDFAGYSTCAIGCARALGFRLMENFNAPYASIGFSDFWRRWHISLSTWLRDYLYIPLGGNRYGAVRTYAALSLTMLLGGLWHGAAWTFVIWGALHGLLLVSERMLRPVLSRLRFPGMSVLGWAVTLLAVIVTWIYFRAQSVEQAQDIIAALVQWPAGLPPMNQRLVWLAFLALVSMHGLERRFAIARRLTEFPVLILAPLLAAMLTAIVLSPGNSRAFIYFQF